MYESWENYYSKSNKTTRSGLALEKLKKVEVETGEGEQKSEFKPGVNFVIL